jgi:hypothetical protein
MTRFETPINDPQIAALLHGLDLQSVSIAQNPEQATRLNAFCDQYVEPDFLEYDGANAGPGVYSHERISAIGDEGSLLHIRLQRQELGATVIGAVRNVAIISHIDDGRAPSIFSADSDDIIRFDGTRKTTFTIGAPQSNEGLYVVEQPSGLMQGQLERTLERERAMAEVPLVVMTGNGWEYRRSDRHWEKLHDIRRARDKVATAISRGLGYAAVSPETTSAQGTGQFGQKVLA